MVQPKFSQNYLLVLTLHYTSLKNYVDFEPLQAYFFLLTPGPLDAMNLGFINIYLKP
jgi:hypothetical protein